MVRREELVRESISVEEMLESLDTKEFDLTAWIKKLKKCNAEVKDSIFIAINEIISKQVASFLSKGSLSYNNFKELSRFKNSQAVLPVIIANKCVRKKALEQALVKSSLVGLGR